MLEDHKRTGAYYNAVIENKRLFKDKVVLDVGTGSGILAIFSAMAGARKVYAVEATDMAKNARKLVAANKVGRASSRSNRQRSHPAVAAVPVWFADNCRICSHMLRDADLQSCPTPSHAVLCCAALSSSAGPCG